MINILCVLKIQLLKYVEQNLQINSGFCVKIKEEQRQKPCMVFIYSCELLLHSQLNMG